MYYCNITIFFNICSFRAWFNTMKIIWAIKIIIIITFFITICTNDQKIINKLQEKSKSSNCSDICFKPNIKINIENNQCIESCLNNGYEYELNNICYNECPKDSFPISDDELDISNFENIKKCYDKTPEGY